MGKVFNVGHVKINVGAGRIQTNVSNQSDRSFTNFDRSDVAEFQQILFNFVCLIVYPSESFRVRFVAGRVENIIDDASGRIETDVMFFVFYVS